VSPRLVMDHGGIAAGVTGLGRPGNVVFPPASQCSVSEIDWSVELRRIEREYEGLPPERTRTQLRLQKIQEITAKERFAERLALAGIWARLVLVAALTLSLFWWPYGRQCGVPLVAFLLSYATAIVGGLALSIRAWRDRLAWAFVGSTLCVVVAWTIVAAHTLPRLGYLPVGGVSTGWSCSANR
jgi:hypothetical protein